MTRRTHDRIGRVVAVGNQLTVPGSSLDYRYTHDSANQRTRTTREDDSYWKLEYDRLGQLAASRQVLAGGVPIAGRDFAWTFDDIGNRRTATVNGATGTYFPNLLNQYSGRTVPGVIDVAGAAGLGTTVTVAVNDGPPQPTVRQRESFHHQLVVDNATVARAAAVKITGVKNLIGALGEDAVTELVQPVFLPRSPEEFTHDADGNLLSDGRWVYTWDAENRLSAIETHPAAAAAGVTRRRLEFVHDGSGRRIAKRIFAWKDAQWTMVREIHFLFDGWNLLAEVDAGAGDTPVRSYLWGLDLSGSSQGAGGVGGLLSMTDGATGRTYFTAYDGNGNVGGLVDAADGSLAARYDYAGFGLRVLSEGPYARDNPFGFSTKYTDAETGHLYYGLRSYDPDTGRWLSRDPIEEEGGENVYAFNFNNAVRFVDGGGDRPSDVWRVPFTVVRGLMGLPVSVLSGDIFDKKNTKIITEFGGNCRVLITVNGIWNDTDAADQILGRASKSPRYRGAHAIRVQNGTHFKVGDIVQIVGHELGAIDITAVRLANQLSAAGAALKNAGCCCGSIEVLAHSQGAMVFNRALPLVDNRTKRLICFTGIGGEKAIVRGSGLASTENLGNKHDWVPVIGNYNPLRVLDVSQLVNGFEFTKTRSASPSWIEHKYVPHYDSHIQNLKPNCPCTSL